MKLRYIPPTTDDVIEYTEDEVGDTIYYWETTLISAVMGEDVTFKSMEQYINQRWEMMELPKMYNIDSGVFVFCFHSATDHDSILVGTWMFGGKKPLILLA